MIGKCSSKYIYLTNQVNDCNKGKTTNYIKKFACVSVVQFFTGHRHEIWYKIIWNDGTAVDM